MTVSLYAVVVFKPIFIKCTFIFPFKGEIQGTINIQGSFVVIKFLFIL